MGKPCPGLGESQKSLKEGSCTHTAWDCFWSPSTGLSASGWETTTVPILLTCIRVFPSLATRAPHSVLRQRAQAEGPGLVLAAASASTFLPVAFPERHLWKQSEK